MRGHIRLLILLALLGACERQDLDRQRITPPESTVLEEMRSETNLAFEQLCEQFILGLWKLFPSWAISEGYYEVARNLQVPDQNYRKYLLVFAQIYKRKFSALNENQLSINSRSNLALIKNFLDRLQWQYTSFKSYQWDPSLYNVSHAFALILNSNYAPVEKRLHAFSTRMSSVPEYYKAAAKAIHRPARPQLELAIQQNTGALSLFGEQLVKTVKKSHMPADAKAIFLHRLQDSRAAIQGYIDFLKNLKMKITKSGNFRDFRIGETLYEEKFQFDINIGITAVELYQLAITEKQRTHKKMTELTDKLWPKYFPEDPPPSNHLIRIGHLLEKLSLHHPSKENFKRAIEEQIPELAEFVVKKNLLSLDKEKPLIVRTTPPYMQGFSVASIDAPGPYDKGANTFYNVMPIENYSDERADSLLREYNDYTLQILNIHEAIPGHYTQLVYANQSPSIIRNILGNTAMIEGWAVYAERMMLDAGYGDFSPELWLMYYKWSLRTITNTILDYELQVKGIDQAQAMKIMVREAFQQQAEAEGKWRRATLSQVQLTSYFAGFTDILALRKEIKQKLGRNFNLEAFHEDFLSFGNAPVPVIRELMLAKIKGDGRD
ncbi:DUF885 domain-containing protein [Microbulbifer sp. OS29]|uniref:DUF885 domain-containing protein n=1 Tax=Microbulbifer okhotskensis TaxID=2926617 RepID=A0A9X2ENK7_9GAMM|nr:DUF885 domain-containing protein [Microbulbifer okhotskensis]MCO1334460.1 DUF885 domain-containing protein [Microbulbifer okhotskensis]